MAINFCHLSSSRLWLSIPIFDSAHPTIDRTNAVPIAIRKPVSMTDYLNFRIYNAHLGPEFHELSLSLYQLKRELQMRPNLLITIVRFPSDAARPILT